MRTLNNKTLVGVAMWMLVAVLGSGIGSAQAQTAVDSDCDRAAAAASSGSSGSDTPREALLPAGTEIRVRLLEAVNSASAKERQPLLLETLEDIEVNGEVVVARGARAEGTVVRAQRRHGFGRRGKVAFAVERVQGVDGEMLPLGNETSFRGSDRYSKAGVITLLFGPFGIFVKGNDVEIPAGAELTSYLRTDRLVRLPNIVCSTISTASLDRRATRISL